MHLLDHDPGEFLLAITGGICLAHGETEAAPIEITGKFSRVSTLIMWRRWLPPQASEMNAFRQTWDALDQDVPIPSCAQTLHIVDRGFSRIVHDLNAIGR